MKKILIILFAILGIAFALQLVNNKPQPETKPQPTPEINIQGEVEIGANGGENEAGMVTSPRTGNEPAQTYVVKIKNMQFDPQIKNIYQGDSITFVNEDAVPHLIASDPHPAHTALPGFESQTLQPGQSYTFKFEQIGRWGYHCHLHPSMVGTINTQQKALSK